MVSDNNDLLSVVGRFKDIYIYGAGKNAVRLYPILEKADIDIAGFYVSDMSGNPDSLFDLPVMPIDQYDPASNSLIILPLSYPPKNYQMEIFTLLKEKGIKNVYVTNFSLLNEIEEKRQQKLLEKKKIADKEWKVKVAKMSTQTKNICNSGSYHMLEDVPVEDMHALFGMDNGKGEICSWRVRYEDAIDSGYSKLADVFTKRTALEEFESQFGTYNLYSALDAPHNLERASCSVFMACSNYNHYFVNQGKYFWLIPIQVGAALTRKNVCDVKDNWGEDNISERNPIYSEGTAIYWMWKNAPRTDYIGLCHYRRHFNVEEDMPQLLADNGIDVLTTAPSFVFDSIGEFFKNFIPPSDTHVLLEAIKTLHPGYYDTARQYLRSRFFPPCNLFVMRYALFQEYAEYLFSTTFAIEKYYSDISFYRKDRHIGFLIECLMGIFLMKHRDRLKIAYTDMLFY